MARKENPPFPRGATFYDGTVPNIPGTSTPDTISHQELEGKTWVWEDVDYSASASGVKLHRSGRFVTTMVVRNKAGATLTTPAKLLARMKTDGTGQEFTGQVSGVDPAVGELCYPIDEFLPGNVVANDLFWVVVDGPAKVITDTGGDTTIAIGNYVIPGATTDGRVIDQDTTVAAGAATFAQIQGAVGIAITATTGNTQTLTIDVHPRHAM